MVVEDDPCFRAVVALMLQRLGFKSVTLADDGQHAWAQLNLVHFDFILSDWNMEPMDGLSFLRSLRASPCYSDMPVVLMSADVVFNHSREAIDAGATEFLLKPFTYPQLHETVRNAFGKPPAVRRNIIRFPAPKGSCARKNPASAV